MSFIKAPGGMLFYTPLGLMLTTSLLCLAALEDKRRAVMTLLQDVEWGQWSDREIAQRCKVEHKTVGKIRVVRQESVGLILCFR